MTTTSNEPAPPKCPVCRDTGWKVVEVPSKASRVIRCDCRVSTRVERLLKAAHIPSRYQKCTLANFEVDFQDASPSLANALWEVKRFIEEYPLVRTGLLLLGPIGIGKTHLAVGIIKELIISKGVPCLFSDYRELLKEIQNSYNPQVNATELEILRPVFDAEVLVLDELGAIKPTDWVWDTVSYILNYRYNEKKKTTIVTTNFPDLPSREAQKEQERKRQKRSRQQEADAERDEPLGDKIPLGDRITDRMRSRLHEMCRVIIFEGADFRILPSSHHALRTIR